MNGESASDSPWSGTAGGHRTVAAAALPSCGFGGPRTESPEAAAESPAGTIDLSPADYEREHLQEAIPA